MIQHSPAFCPTVPAEWELPCAVLVAWPHEATDWAYMLGDVAECYRCLVGALAAEGIRVVAVAPDAAQAAAAIKDISPEAIDIVELPTNDTWTRDYGPLTRRSADGSLSLLDFAFNGWGLKFAADRDNLVTLGLARLGILKEKPLNHLGFVLEGGSIESDGKGTILTTSRCLTSPNRNGIGDKQVIEALLREMLGAQRVLWLDHGALAGDDTDSHIDTLARLAPDDTILYVACSDTHDEHFEELAAMRTELRAMHTAAGGPYRLLPLPLPRPVYDEDGLRLPATYANFLALPEAVFVPTYAQPDLDAEALATIAEAFPGKKVTGIDCRPLIRQHGSLHCATMQIPLSLLNL